MNHLRIFSSVTFVKAIEDSQNSKTKVNVCYLWDMKPDQNPTDALTLLLSKFT